jgi:endonuclease YncB( thermonuclease family)
MSARIMPPLLLGLLLASCAASDTDPRTPASDGSAADRSRAATVQEAAATPADAAAPRPSREPCVIAAVSDGDSIRCAEQGRVRLLLLDAPEMDQVPFGTRSRDALRRRLTRGDTVWLEFDVQRADRYNRTLAHVWTSASEGTHVNLAHARDGWAVAVVFPPNVRHIEAIRAAVAQAREQRRGLWADGRFTCEPIAHKRGDC